MLLLLPGGAEILLLLLLALLIDTAVGGSSWLMRWLPGPGDLAAGAAGWFDRRLNRIERSDEERRLRGTLVVLTLVLAAALSGLAVTLLARLSTYGWALELFLLTRMVTVRRPIADLWEIMRALVTGGVEAGRTALMSRTGRPAGSLDMHGIVRAAVETAAGALQRGVVGPVFWYLLLGLPGALVWSVADAAHAAIGHSTPRYRYFGSAALSLSRWMGWGPARLAAILTALAALFVPRAAARMALRTALDSAPGHPEGNAAWPIAAFAGALNLSLAGPRRDGDVIVRDPWLGEGRARATLQDIRPALALFAVAVLLTAGLAAGIGLVGLRFGL